MKEIKNKTKKMLEAQSALHATSLEEELRRLYVDCNLPMQEIAEKLNISRIMLKDWLLKAGIYSRKIEIPIYKEEE